LKLQGADVLGAGGYTTTFLSFLLSFFFLTLIQNPLQLRERKGKGEAPTPD
jgi:hypothetical protein